MERKQKINETIIKFMPLAKHIALHIANKYDLNYDEIESHAYESLCNIINNKESLENDNNIIRDLYIKIYAQIKCSVLKEQNLPTNSYWESLRVLSFIKKQIQEYGINIIKNQDNLNFIIEEMVKDGIIKTISPKTIKGYIRKNISFSLDEHKNYIIDDGGINAIIDNSLIANLKEALKELPERKIQILILRYGLNGTNPKNLPEIASLYCISKQRIQQIIEKSFELLKPICEKYIEDEDLVEETFSNYGHISNFDETNLEYENDLINDDYSYKKM